MKLINILLILVFLVGSGMAAYGPITMRPGANITLDDGYIHGAISQTVKNVKSYDASGNGIADDTSEIQAAINDSALSIVWIPDGTYMVDAETSIIMRSNTTLLMSPGATLKAIANDNTHYRILKLENITNVQIIGGYIEGERHDHTGVTGEYGNGIDIRNSTNVVIDNVHISDCWGDGIFIYANATAPYSYSENIWIKNVISTGNRRQGMSICGAKDVLVEHSEFSETNGTAPQSGVDLEPDFADCFNERITFIDCKFVDNTGVALLSDNFRNFDITFIGCEFRALADSYSLWFSGMGTCPFIACKFTGPITSISNAQFRDCSFETDSTFTAGRTAVSCVTDYYVLFDACNITASGNRSAMYLAGSTTDATRKKITNSKVIYNGNGLPDMGGVVHLYGNVSISNTEFIHTGAAPATGYYVVPTDIATYKVRITDCYFDPVFNYAFGFQGRQSVSKLGAWGSTAPTTGYWRRGDVVFNATAASGQAAGFICISAGTPGTWKTFGTIA